MLVAALAIVTLTIALPASPTGPASYPWSYDVAVDLLSLPPNHAPSPHVVDWNNDGREDLLVGLRQVANAEVTFTVIATLDSLARSVERLVADGDIDARLGRSLLTKLGEAKAAADRGDTTAAATILTSFINEVRAQRGKKISPSAADLLLADAEFVRSRLGA